MKVDTICRIAAQVPFFGGKSGFWDSLGSLIVEKGWLKYYGGSRFKIVWNLLVGRVSVKGGGDFKNNAILLSKGSSNNMVQL